VSREGPPATKTAAVGPLTALREAFRSGLEAELAEAFAAEIARTNFRRARVMLPLFCVGHAIHVAVFWPTALERITLPSRVLEWHQGIASIHAVTLVVALGLVVHVLVRGGDRPSRWVGPATALTYLLHAAAIVSVDQLAVTSVTPFIAYCLGIAGVTVLAPLATVVVYAAALATFVTGVFAFQTDPSLRLAVLPSGISTVVISVALAILLFGARRREFVQRTTIDKQQRELEELNANLERRVAGQVSEIVARAEEVERLNAQLRAQVRERSRELSMALARLARQEGGGDLPRGTVLGGRFEIEASLGEGGMGVVYSGVDRTTGDTVAIKVIQAASHKQLAALERFLREARTAAAVNHPAVVRMLHVDVSENGMLYQVQELVNGETLAQRMRRAPAWEASLAARVVAVLSDALAVAHAEGVVHRDVKPANVMLTREEPGLKLLDFGISKLYDDVEWAEDATVPGTVIGTPEYMSPEQVSGRQLTDRVDVYATGVIFYSLLTGRHPFEDDRSRGMLVHHIMTEPADVASIEPGVPVVLSRWVARCLRKKPEERPTAAELSTALRAFADDAGAPPLERLGDSETRERTAVEARQPFDGATE
jgi:serine/threonine-protein kinase